MSAIHSHPGCFVSRASHRNRMNRLLPNASLFSLFIFSFVNPSPTFAQEPRPSNPAPLPAGMKENLNTLVATPGISGNENELAEKIRVELSALHPKTDNLGDVVVTIGSGAPNRLIVTPIDEPGFVVSGITEQGYLRVQRLPQSGLPPIFNELYSAQPVKVGTTTGKWIDGGVGGL